MEAACTGCTKSKTENKCRLVLVYNVINQSSFHTNFDEMYRTFF